MNYRKIPKAKDNDKVSMLGFGCMRFPVLKDGEIDEAQVEEMFKYGISNGINYIDTAYGYHDGKSEPLVGKILKKLDLRKKINLVTKLPSYLVQGNRGEAELEEYFNEQLERLQTDYFDYYLIHTLTYKFWENVTKAGLFKFIDRIKKEGKVRHIGFSFHDELPLFKKIVDAYDWDFCMIQYNFLDTDYQAGREGYEYATAKGMGVFAMEPLRGGLLVNNLPQDIKDEWKNSGRNYSPVEWSLRWLWNHKNISLTLSGMSSLEQMKENVSIVSKIQEPLMTKDDLKVIEKVKKIYQSKIKVNCTSCKYCMPCPAGVNIHGNFGMYNNASMFNNFKKFKNEYNDQSKDSLASKCVACGACEKVCPQGIKIIEELKIVSNYFIGNN
ncbi:MAG: aldo/keto reductase [Fusobacteriaceae bacterium]